MLDKMFKIDGANGYITGIFGEYNSSDLFPEAFRWNSNLSNTSIGLPCFIKVGDSFTFKDSNNNNWEISMTANSVTLSVNGSVSSYIPQTQFEPNLLHCIIIILYKNINGNILFKPLVVRPYATKSAPNSYFGGFIDGETLSPSPAYPDEYPIGYTYGEFRGKMSSLASSGLSWYYANTTANYWYYENVSPENQPPYSPGGNWGAIPSGTVINYSETGKIEEDIDPYHDGGDSDINPGGEGTFDNTSDDIEDPALPTISSADTGFTRIYNPTLAQVQSLANYLWTDQSVIQTIWNHIKQFLENPMDAFIAFNLVPCSVPDAGNVEFKVMYIGTGIYMNRAANQFVDVDCGTIKIDKYYDSALDYSPYTKISIFLPYVGSVQLDADDVMGKTVGVKYRIDIVSGGCVAKVFVDGSIHYQFSGHCAITIPFTSADFSTYVGAMIQTAKAVASIGAAAAGAPGAGAALADMPTPKTGQTTETIRNKSLNTDTGRLRTTSELSSTTNTQTQASFDSIVGKNISNTVGAVMSSKTVIEKTGSFSGNTGYLGVRRPYVMIERPRMCNPEKYGRYNGRPSMLYLNLSQCQGFTQIQQVQLTGIPATNPELDEISSLMKAGIVI